MGRFFVQPLLVPQHTEAKMTEEMDPVKLYGKGLGWELRPRTVLIEGTTDADVFRLCARLEHEKTGNNLLEGLAIIPAGEKDRGGTSGVIRELIVLRNMARNIFSPKGRSVYRFIGLLDNDKAGIMAIKDAQRVDTSILEYKDIFRLQPVMPSTGNLDPKTLRTTFERDNVLYKGLDWEIEDLIPDQFVLAFLEEHQNFNFKETVKNGKIHRDMSPDCKAKLHQFIRNNAVHQDLEEVKKVLQALRFYLALPPITKC
jgi:hypothetical protein